MIFLKKSVDISTKLCYSKVKLTIMIIIINKVNAERSDKMSTLRNSKQRDAVLQNLSERYDHPTAEEVYISVKKVIPSVSLATVYRNLKLLESEGLIIKITTPDSDRFDGHTHEHYHFTCNECKQVLDIELSGGFNVNALPKSFGGKITNHELMFYGLCENCNKI